MEWTSSTKFQPHDFYAYVAETLDNSLCRHPFQSPDGGRDAFMTDRSDDAPAHSPVTRTHPTPATQPNTTRRNTVATSTATRTPTQTPTSPTQLQLKLGYCSARIQSCATHHLHDEFDVLPVYLLLYVQCLAWRQHLRLLGRQIQRGCVTRGSALQVVYSYAPLTDLVTTFNDVRRPLFELSKNVGKGIIGGYSDARSARHSGHSWQISKMSQRRQLTEPVTDRPSDFPPTLSTVSDHAEEGCGATHMAPSPGSTLSRANFQDRSHTFFSECVH